MLMRNVNRNVSCAFDIKRIQWIRMCMMRTNLNVEFVKIENEILKLGMEFCFKLYFSCQNFIFFPLDFLLLLSEINLYKRQ